MLEAVREGIEVASATFLLRRLVALGRELTFREPIKVNVTKDVECYVADSRRFSVHGTGDTVNDALTNYVEEFVRYFDWLVEKESELAPVLQKELKAIRKLLVKVS
jgi:hypothetical protein